MLGHNHKGEYIPQINLALVFSLDKTQPGFFRMIPGSIRDVSSVVATVQELNLKEIVFIGDKGFSSEKNAKAFSAAELKYIIPLKRNSTLIDYDILKRGRRKEFDGLFQFDKRHILSGCTIERLVEILPGNTVIVLAEDFYYHFLPMVLAREIQYCFL
jgi:transposase